MTPRAPKRAPESHKRPAYQWYPKDHDTDERVKLMSLAQEGAYRRLLDHQWLHGSIPDDMEFCSKICRATVKEFRRLWPGVRACFEPVESGRLAHPRLERQRQELESRAQVQAANGRSGAAKVWGRRSRQSADEASPSVLTRVANDNHKETTVLVDSADDGLAIDLPPEVGGSPDSKLQAPEKIHEHLGGAWPGGQMVPREHRAHAVCGRVCVPAFLHRQFLRAMGGDSKSTGEQLRSWYLQVERELKADEVVQSDAAKFWRPRFDAAFVKSRTPVDTGRTVSVARTGAAPAGKYASVGGGGS